MEKVLEGKEEIKAYLKDNKIKNGDIVHKKNQYGEKAYEYGKDGVIDMSSSENGFVTIRSKEGYYNLSAEYDISKLEIKEAVKDKNSGVPNIQDKLSTNKELKNELKEHGINTWIIKNTIHLHSGTDESNGRSSITKELSAEQIKEAKKIISKHIEKGYKLVNLKKENWYSEDDKGGGSSESGYVPVIEKEFAKNKLAEGSTILSVSEDKFYKDNEGKFYKNKTKVSEELFCVDVKKINGKKFELGATIESEEELIQTPYYAASETCSTLDTVVPNSMAVEQRKFNEYLRNSIAILGMSVEEYVAKKLHYRNVEDLCYEPNKLDEAGRKIVRFSREQVDAIATAIYNYENGGDAIIIADQTGIGKGRQAAGILRYAALELKAMPIFFTEKKHLINDIYRDLIAIGFDAGVPTVLRRKVEIDASELTDSYILREIKKDIKENEEVTLVDFSFPDWWENDYLIKGADDTSENFDEIETITAELIELYRQHFLENGKDVYEPVDRDTYAKNVTIALRDGKKLFRPYIPYSGIEIKDSQGNVIYPSITNKELQKIWKYKSDGKKSPKPDPELKMSDMELPAEFGMMAIPYSQVSRPFIAGTKAMHPKTLLLQKYAFDDKRKCVLVLDESHTASGITSNVGEIMAPMIKAASMVTYLSATYAKRPDNMPLYALRTSIRESGLNDEELVDVFTAGGNALQEAVSAELTRNGQLLRREKLIQGVSKYYYEKEGTETGDNQINKLDRIAGLYAKVLDFASKVRQVISEHKNNLTTEEKAKIKNARGVNALAFNLFNFMLLGLKVRQSTERAIENLKNGRKVIVTVASTMESALDNMSKTFMSNANADSYKMGDKIKNDFALYMAYLLNYTMRWNEIKVTVNDEGQQEETKETVYVLDSEDELSTRIKDRLYNEYVDLIQEILSYDTGIPIAPLDMIKKNIADAGFTINEITGRQRCITFEDGDTAYGTIAKRNVIKTDVLVRDFNENAIDCLLINQSGAVGISMHALPNNIANIVYETPKDEDGKPVKNEDGVVIDKAPTSLENKKEVKKRAMIITQMELDINKEVQKLGRINRTGQVYEPEYTYIISAIPSEARLTALMEQKLRSLSANVSSNQEQGSYMFSFDDFFSDEAVEPFNETMKDLKVYREPVRRGSQIKDYSKTLYFKDYKFQKDFYETFAKRLKEYIEQQIKLGLFKGKMTQKDYLAETIFSVPFFVGDNNAKTSFGRHSSIEKVNVQLFKEKNTERKITEAITDHLKIKIAPEGSYATAGSMVKEDLFFSRLSDYQPKAIARLDLFEKDKVEFYDKQIKEANEEISTIKLALSKAHEDLKKFDKLEEALATEKELKEIAETTKTHAEEITKAAIAGNMEEVGRLSLEMNGINVKKKELEEKFAVVAEMLSQKEDQRELKREIKNIEDRIERAEKKVTSNLKSSSEYRNLVKKGKEYIMQIGGVFDLVVCEETKEFDENGWNITKVNYKEVLRQSVVMTGVSFPYDGWELTPSKFEIHLTGVSEKFTYNIYKLNKNFKEEEKALGYKETESLTMTSDSYKGVWNEYAGKFDNSYREDRYIIVGSLPRTYSLSRKNSLTGQIIKFNYKDGKTRLGIELTDNKEDETGSRGRVEKSVYKILDERYSPESQLQYPVYYDGNTENVNKFIYDYIYYTLFGKVVEGAKKRKNGIEAEDRIEKPNSEFVFQITSRERQIFIVVQANENHRYTCSDLINQYNNKETLDKDIPKKEDVLSGLNFRVLSDNIQAVDYFAFYLQKEVGTPITDNNYRLAGKSTVFKDIQSRGRMLSIFRFYRGTQFKTFFPTNVVELENYMNYGLRYVAQLEMNFNEFDGLMKAFERVRRKPSFATASLYFEKFKADYVFEQFNDEFEVAEIDEENRVKFVAPEDRAKQEIDSLIDELVQMVILLD